MVILPQDQVLVQRSTLVNLLNIALCADMLGFKLEMPRREDSLKEKTRPIYLDMQVCGIVRYPAFTGLMFLVPRPRRPSTLVYLTLCCRILPTSTATHIVARMRTDGRLSRLWRMPAKYDKQCFSSASKILIVWTTARRGLDWC